MDVPLAEMIDGCTSNKHHAPWMTHSFVLFVTLCGFLITRK
jgi:hypothetical protein